MADNKLILMVGLPRSGKTTRAKKLSKDLNAPIVSPDAIRRVVCGQSFYPRSEPLIWGVAKTMVMSLFESGHHVVILDACSHTRERRNDWQSGYWKIEFQVVTTPTSVCRQRVVDAGSDPNLLSVIDRMAAAYEPPVREEGNVVSTAGF